MDLFWRVRETPYQERLLSLYCTWQQYRTVYEMLEPGHTWTTSPSFSFVTPSFILL